jgi:hypothetical protein
MSRPHRYLVFTLALASLIGAGRYALAASDAQIARLRSTSSDDDISQYMGLVAARGLAGGAMPDPRASQQIPSPIPGTSVSESLVKLTDTGERVSKVTTWSESLGSGVLELQESIAAAGQTTVEYWLFASDRRRCVLNGGAVYGKEGRLLRSDFWRNDPQLPFVNSTVFPDRVFPTRIPPSAVLIALNAQKPGATGTLNVSLGRYGYMTFDLWAQDIEQITVPAGSFRTLKVIMRVNADSVMKYWPRFLRRLAQPFFPQNVLYYDTAAPTHHLVKFVGSFGYLAPQVTVEMTRIYIASEAARNRR